MDPAPTTGGSPIVSYEVRSWNGSDWVHEGNVAAVKDKTAGYTYTDENLEPNTRYYYVVQARNSVGTGPWSDHLEVSTIAGAPDAPVVTATALSSSSILVSWTVPDDNGEPITGYQVQRWDGANGDMWDPVTGTHGTDQNTQTVTEYRRRHRHPATTGLASGTEYFYRVRALTSAIRQRGLVG